jgi:CubicO group peptidase (beta-lactamase class C family)
MRRVFTLVIGVGLLAWGCGDASVTTTSTPAATSTSTPASTSQATTTLAVTDPLCERTGSTLAELPLPADLEAVFDPVVTEGMAAMDAVGLTLAVQCAESPLYVKGYGSADLASGVPATEDTVYEIGSVSKQFVAAEIMKLAQEDRLSLDDPIGKYLSWLPADWQPVTLEQLLNHTGGIPDHFAIFRENPDTPFDWTKDYAAAELVEVFVALDDRLVDPPGTAFFYSNTDYAILTSVIEQLTAQPFAASMDKALFAPLGLERTAFCSPTLPDLAVGYNIGPDGPIPGPEIPASFFSGAAGICSSAGDLVLWERHLVEGTAVSREAFQAMSSPADLNDGTTVPYGLGLHLDKLGQSEAIFHEGGTASFSSWLAYYPDHDLIVTVLSNTLGPNPIGIQDMVIDLTNVAVGQ